jgi:putative transposase
LKGFIDQHRDTYGVEPICKVLQVAPSGYRRYAACQRNPSLRSIRAQRDDGLMPQIERVWHVNGGLKLTQFCPLAAIQN